MGREPSVRHADEKNVLDKLEAYSGVLYDLYTENDCLLQCSASPRDHSGIPWGSPSSLMRVPHSPRDRVGKPFLEGISRCTQKSEGNCLPAGLLSEEG